MRATSVRARVRAEMADAIKAAARHQLAVNGVNLSLRAVAKEMGMVSSALYRYFANRDDLLTALIADAWNDLGEAAEAGDAAIADRTDLLGRWLGVCHGVRRWAVAHPAEYTLLFGSPGPGCTAPEDTLPAVTRTPGILLRILDEGLRDGRVTDPGPAALPEEVRADFDRIRAIHGVGTPADLIVRGFTGWTHLVGIVSLEVFGRFTDVIEAREAHFDHQVRQVAGLIGLQPPTPLQRACRIEPRAVGRTARG